MSVDQFSIDEQKLLLRCARDAIQAAFVRKSPPPVSATPRLDIQRGLFVTLHKAGQLRGCIGRMSSVSPLMQTIQEMAVAAAFQDPRFPPLNQAELALVDIELSILSPMKVSKPKLVQPGLHGVHLHFHGNSGVFLPQVATEQGWDRNTLLENLCHKAGVPSGSHLLPGAVLQTFTAFVFGEKQLEQLGKYPR